MLDSDAEFVETLSSRLTWPEKVESHANGNQGF
jgi:hypothetical protein